MNAQSDDCVCRRHCLFRGSGGSQGQALARLSGVDHAVCGGERQGGRAGERITISAMFEGQPKPGVVTEGGPVYLGDEKQELDGEGTAKFAGVRLDAKG